MGSPAPWIWSATRSMPATLPEMRFAFCICRGLEFDARGPRPGPLGSPGGRRCILRISVPLGAVLSRPSRRSPRSVPPCLTALARRWLDVSPHPRTARDRLLAQSVAGSRSPDSAVPPPGRCREKMPSRLRECRSIALRWRQTCRFCLQSWNATLTARIWQKFRRCPPPHH